MIREADHKDAFKLIVRLSKETDFYKPDLDTFIRTWKFYKDINAGIILGEYSDNLDGIISAIAMPEPNTGIMTAVERHFYVIPEKRNKGIGRQLFDAFMAWSIKQNCKLVMAAHPYEQEWMSKFFERFKKIETVYIKEI